MHVSLCKIDEFIKIRHFRSMMNKITKFKAMTKEIRYFFKVEKDLRRDDRKSVFN